MTMKTHSEEEIKDLAKRIYADIRPLALPPRELSSEAYLFEQFAQWHLDHPQVEIRDTDLSHLTDPACATDLNIKLK